MTPFSALRGLAGLSLREASEFHKVRLDTVKSWSAGKNHPSSAIITELRDLIEKQERAANEALEQIASLAETHGMPEEIEIGFPADNYEAQTLGWPSVGAWTAMAARVISQAPVAVKLVPRGSTAATAAASDAHKH